MAKYPFNNKELRDAVRIYAERRTDALKASLSPEPVQFSPKFRARIAQISSDADAAIKRRHKIRTRAAAAIIAFIVLITAFFSFNTTARAEFVNWIKNIYKEFIVYHFFGEATSDQVSEIILEWLPEGFDLTETDKTADHLSYVYESYDRTSIFMIDCDKTHSGSAVFITDQTDDRQHLSLTIAGYEVDCYVSANAASDYIWHDAGGKFFFSMNSNLPHEINVKIIENLKIESK